jgi:5-methylcytosine-specific restriction protein A
MPIFLLTWNPKKYENLLDGYDEYVAVSTNGQIVQHDWSTGHRTGGIRPGDQAFLVRQRQDRGIVAAGTFLTEVYQREDWTGQSGEANYADVAWDTWLPATDHLPVEHLLAQVPGVPWNNLQASGVMVAEESADDLMALWGDHLADLGRQPARSAEELTGAETYHEGAIQRVEVNRYERDPRARAAALSTHGYDCVVCGFNYEAVYGKRGKDFIHVHHLLPVSELPEGYEVDPVKDLVPVCANCHGMIHRTKPAMTPGKLRSLLSRP